MKRWLMLFMFLLILIGPNINWTILNYLENKSEHKNTLSENRNLATLEPLSIDNLESYPLMVENYINDHAPFRTEIIDFYSYINFKLFNSITSTTNVVHQGQITDDKIETIQNELKANNKSKSVEKSKKENEKISVEKLEGLIASKMNKLELNNDVNETTKYETESEKSTKTTKVETTKYLLVETSPSNETIEKSSAKRIEEAKQNLAEETASELNQEEVLQKAVEQKAIIDAREALETQVLENPKEPILKETESGDDDLKINLVIQGKEGWFFYAGEDSIIDALGVEPFTDEQHARILEKLIKVRNKFTKENINFVLFIPPNKERIYSEYLPDQYKNITGTSRVEELIKYLRKNSDIKVVYPREELLNSKSICDVYYKSDTHWNLVGGYVGSQSLVSSLIGYLPPISDLEIEGEVNVVSGDLQQMARLPNEWINDMYYNIKGLTDIATDAEFEANDEEKTGQGLIIANANNPKDNRKLVMIRDSYAINMLPEICSYYEKSTLIHWQKIKSTPKELFEDGDIFVIEYVERYLRNLEELLDELLAK